MEDCLIAARLAGVSQLKYEVPGYGTATFELKSEKAAGDREPVQAAERSFIERTASRKEKPTEEQKEAASGRGSQGQKGPAEEEQGGEGCGGGCERGRACGLPARAATTNAARPVLAVCGDFV